MKITKVARFALSLLPYVTLSMCPWITPLQSYQGNHYATEQEQYEAAQKKYGEDNVSMATDGNMLINGVEVPFGTGS